MEDEHQNSYFWAAYVDFMMIVVFIAFGLGAAALAKYRNEKKKVEILKGKFYTTKEQNDSLALNLEKYVSLVQEADHITAVIEKEFDNKNLRVDFTNSKKIKLEGDFLFKSGGATLRPEAIDSIVLIGKSLVAALKKDSNFAKCAIMVEGHADSTDTEFNNYILSFNRSLAIVQIWADSCNLKMPEYDILPVGFGELYPYNGNQNSTSEERRLNRRIEIAIMPKLNEFFNIVRAAQKKGPPVQARYLDEEKRPRKK
ncbi:flagellar motor protein MotB [Niastella sp. OAS944]|uniref:OmpA/MotB family protein n=1 Tax=Niastella sp. OAS944 TaxID=2664089 RepID=UPI003476652E|nr:flagellar motor protein MotB [Chitinophagaceae bacterium OAS944]